MGSIGDNTSGGSYPYRTSKAAMDMVVKPGAGPAPRGIRAVVLHPGWVLTEMGGPNRDNGGTECNRHAENAGAVDERIQDVSSLTMVKIPW